MPIQLVTWCRLRAVVRDRPGQRAARRPRAAGRAAKTIVECPSENQKPTLSGRLPSDISLRVVLSIAEMWSASKAWRRPERVGGHADPDRERAAAAEAGSGCGATSASSIRKPATCRPTTTIAIIASVRRCPASSERSASRRPVLGRELARHLQRPVLRSSSASDARPLCARPERAAPCAEATTQPLSIANESQLAAGRRRGTSRRTVRRSGNA